jgi:hypothetical protein
MKKTFIPSVPGIHLYLSFEYCGFSTGGSYYDLETLAGSARTYTLENFSAWAANNRVYFRVKCVSSYNETISYNC